MKMVNIHEAKTHLSRLLEEVAGGEEIILAKAGRPMATLSPYKEKKNRQPGVFAGQMSETADAWDEDAELQEQMENGVLYGGELSSEGNLVAEGEGGYQVGKKS